MEVRMPPSWLETLSIIVVAISALAALWITADLRRHPQAMWIMNLVWPLTALYTGPLGLWAYYAIGRRSARDMHQRHKQNSSPFWQSVLTGAMHCGAGCAVGDLLGEWLLSATGLVIVGGRLGTRYIVAFTLAYLLGIFVQYFSIAPMRGLSLRQGLLAAIKADTLSLTTYEIGMFAWMAVVQALLLPGLEPSRWSYWFMMQTAMCIGLATSFPVNWWLIKQGIKEAM
jgi:hypothetical protein